MNNPISIDLLSLPTFNASFYRLLTEDGFKVEIVFKGLTTKDTYIGDYHINLFSSFFNEFKKINARNTDLKGSIFIAFSNDISNFDSALISLIALFKETFRNIEFEIAPPHNSDIEVFFRFRDVLFSLRSWYQSSNEIYLYSIKNENRFDLGKINEPEGILPIILITPKSFHDYFVKNNFCFDLELLFGDIKADEIIKEIEYNLSLTYNTSGTIANKNYKVIRETIKKFQDQIDWQNNPRIFFQHYLRMLAEFNVLPEQASFLKSSNGNVLKLENFKKRDLNQYEMNKIKMEVKEIILKLKIQPPILTLIFSILINRNLEKTIFNINEYLVHLNELYEFSRNLFYGVRELARNIIEHTESKKGVFSGRIYSGDCLIQIKGIEPEINNSEMMISYYESLNSKGYLTKEIEKENFIDLVLFDEGQKGIVKKTIENIGSLVGNFSMEDNFYLTDIQLLKDKKIVFKDFYNSTEPKLNHHLIRTASHWGLIIFTNLINKNNGLFLASSYSDASRKTFDSCYKFDESIITSLKSSFFEVGSYYNIILPLDKNFNLREDYIANTVPKEPNYSEKNFIELLNYKYERGIKTFKDEGKQTLLQIKVEFFTPQDLQDGYRIEHKIALNIFNYLKQIPSNQKKIIPVFDFENCEEIFDQSKLFRFLSELQKLIDIYSIIIINIKQEIVKIIFKSLMGGFADSQKSDKNLLENAFWNKEHFILVYSYELNALGSRLYFTDILGGYTYSDFFLLNRKIASTHFSFSKLPDMIEIPKFSDETKDNLRNCPFYISDSGIVQNFEMVIEHNGKSLFEHSIEFILNQEI